MKWDYLNLGDTIDIIAPASHAPHDKLVKGSEWLQSLGFHTRMQKGMIAPDAFFAAPLEVQFEQLKNALYSDSKAIWCLRGGYGSMRLIPELKKLKVPKKPKLFVGFSDVTSLHLFFNQVWKWPTLHGRTISQLNLELGNTPDRKELKDLLFGDIDEVYFKNLKPLNSAAEKNQQIKGKVVGGNLRMLQSSLGTAIELNTKGKILFVEDVGERGYSIDRMLEQMHQAGILNKGLRALIFGDFTEGLEKDGKNLTVTAMKRFAQRVDYPVLMGMKAGHGSKFNYSVPFLTESKLSLGKKAELIIQTGGI